MLLPPGKSALEYGKLLLDPVLIERRFEAGLLDDISCSASGRRSSFQFGAASGWRTGSTACKMGKLAILRWLVEHPTGRAAVSVFKVGDDLLPLLYDAVSQGHLDVMQYLYDQDVAFGYGTALLCAIRGDKTDAAKWLLDRFPPTEKIPQYCVLAEAARREVPGSPGFSWVKAVLNSRVEY
ncbi:hypothetical protein PHYSODRAFT_307742 [Phytophthora sojae]|uniref:Ankyrin repeat protein n=1 Tax=Phytophthora sojae (strain P6497) TaxID=1094619 RepID=G5AFW6_PHYSP|nr:hypothetical protein PHYSODRAFT_307742 [Phytophthora sojae]EGZ05482.1 hypothetical protein PHYSODRAFT_307742 [Phytophthora sojae]|eukprot:XP_009539013.1 hypothetical protein PHYSODRAFT_307742 [Phytophthora sojae]